MADAAHLTDEDFDNCDKSTARELTRAIKNNEALARAGKLESFEVNSETASRAIATRLRLIIRDRGLKDEEVAERIGVPPTMISNALENPDGSKVEALGKIAEALDIDVHKVL